MNLGRLCPLGKAYCRAFQSPNIAGEFVADGRRQITDGQAIDHEQVAFPRQKLGWEIPCLRTQSGA